MRRVVRACQGAVIGALLLSACKPKVELPMTAEYFQQVCAASCAEKAVPLCVAGLSAYHDTSTETACDDPMRSFFDCMVENAGAQGWCDPSMAGACAAAESALETCIDDNYGPSVCGQAFARRNACGGYGGTEPGDTPCLTTARCRAACELAASCADLAPDSPATMTPFWNCYDACGPSL